MAPAKRKLKEQEMLNTVKKLANKRIENETLSSRSYEDYISICTKVLNHAKDEKYTYSEYSIPKKFRTTSAYRLTKKNKGISRRI